MAPAYGVFWIYKLTFNPTRNILTMDHIIKVHIVINTVFFLSYIQFKYTKLRGLATIVWGKDK